MARILLICFVLFHVFDFLAAANEELESNSAAHTMVEPKTPSISDPPASSESMGQSPEAESGEYGFAGAPTNRKFGKHRGSTDMSVAGGGVIVGGLAMAIFATIFAYIRVTRRKSRESNQNTS